MHMAALAAMVGDWLPLFNAEYVLPVTTGVINSASCAAGASARNQVSEDQAGNKNAKCRRKQAKDDKACDLFLQHIRELRAQGFVATHAQHKAAQ